MSQLITNHYLTTPLKDQQSSFSTHGFKPAERQPIAATLAKPAGINPEVKPFVKEEIKPVEVKKISEKEAKLIFDKAEEYRKNKDYDNAERLYTEIIEQAVLQQKESEWWFVPFCLLKRGDISQESERFDEAISDFAKAIVLDKEYSPIWLRIRNLLSVVSEPVRKEIIEKIKGIDLSADKYALAFQASCLLECTKFVDGEKKRLLLEKALACCDGVNDKEIGSTMVTKVRQEAQKKLQDLGNSKDDSVVTAEDSNQDMSFIHSGRYIGLISPANLDNKKVNFASEQKPPSSSSPVSSQELSWFGRLNRWQRLRKVNSVMRRVELTAKVIVCSTVST